MTAIVSRVTSKPDCSWCSRHGSVSALVHKQGTSLGIAGRGSSSLSPWERPGGWRENAVYTSYPFRLKSKVPYPKRETIIKGEKLALPKCTHDLNKENFFADFIDPIRAWYAEFGSIPDPNAVSMI